VRLVAASDLKFALTLVLARFQSETGHRAEASFGSEFCAADSADLQVKKSNCAMPLLGHCRLGNAGERLAQSFNRWALCRAVALGNEPGVVVAKPCLACTVFPHKGL
jgi:hypothetical protein